MRGEGRKREREKEKAEGKQRTKKERIEMAKGREWRGRSANAESTWATRTKKGDEGKVESERERGSRGRTKGELRG